VINSGAGFAPGEADIGLWAMNEFTTIFEKTAAGLLASALLYFAIGAGLLIWGIVGFIRHRRNLKQRIRYLLVVLPGLFFCWALHPNLFLFVAYDLRGQPQIAEGVVHVSFMQAYHGHSGGDKITVGDQTFDVDYFYATPGYRRTIAHGGALREGVYARLYHYNGVIVKVEVRKKETGQPSP
jgi:hypothetical protein